MRIAKALLVGLMLAVVSAVAERPPTRCAVCPRRLPERYWTFEGQSCCSPPCVDKLRPVCSRCSRAIDGRYFEVDEKIFCSESCYETILPYCEICATAIHSGYRVARHDYCARCVETCPVCFSCGLPAAHTTKLKDDRVICAPCTRWSVHQPDLAQRHYDRARRYLEAWTSIQLETVPKLDLVDRKEMMDLAGDLRETDSPVPIRGLYSRQTHLRKRGLFGAWKERAADTKETIYIVNYLRDEVFRVAAVHELTHDLVHERFPRLENAPLWVHEGICQQAAAEYCRRRNYLDALRAIETCDDPDYGDGYRYFNLIAGLEGWSALKRWMETVDVATLPKTAPKN